MHEFKSSTWQKGVNVSHLPQNRALITQTRTVVATNILVLVVNVKIFIKRKIQTNVNESEEATTAK